MQSLMVFEGVDSHYTCVKHLDNSQLSKALISKNELSVVNTTLVFMFLNFFIPRHLCSDK